MKKLLTTLSVTFSLIIGAFAQNVVNISGDLTSDATWTSDNIYLLTGYCYVKSGVTITIEPGTVIKGDKVSKGTLIVERGGKLIADGTYYKPIVFTSNQPSGSRSYGDWGGVVLCGKATVNLPGGEGVIEGGPGSLFGGGLTPDDNDNSGIIRYVRIEFAGIPFQPNQEINGLTLGGVGKATIIDHVQVSYCGDDSFEWFGGTADAKYLISHRAWDDDFDTDNGFSGRVQYGVVLRDPDIADQSGSNGFESDNDGQGNAVSPYTSPVFSNVSVFGPQFTPSTIINSQYRRALHLRRNTKIKVYNSLFAGYPTGLLIDGASTETNATNEDLQFRNNIIAACGTNLAVLAGSPFDIATWYASAGFNNSLLANYSDLQVSDPTNLSAPNFLPSSGSPLLSGADFSNANLQGGYFDTTSFRGAFGNDNWTACWANFNPQNNPYTSATDNSFIGTIQAAGNTTICSGSTVTLTAINPAGTYSYLWSNGANTQSIDAGAGTYTVRITNTETGCSLTTPAVTVIQSNPVAQIAASGPTTICQGSNVVLDAGAGFNSYLWSDGSTSQTVTVSATSLLTVTVTDSIGCTATSEATQVTVEAPPVASFVSQANQLTLSFTNTSTGTNNTYVWDFGNGQTATTQAVSPVTYPSTNTYTITLTATNNCGTSTETEVVFLSDAAITVSGNITSDTTWNNSSIVLLSGFVFVKNGATLTIEKGTVIKGEESTRATLIIERGGKLIANGTKNQPIVFTSNLPVGSRSYGDWGGIILCGKAPVNLPGGEGVIEGGTGATFGGGNNPDPNDNSGSLKYVRIEFSGIPHQPNQEINGLTMGGVGLGTTIENIQVSYCGDDSYEWFGGTVNAKKLIAFRGWDDDFDTDNGFVGKVQFGVSLRDPNIADQSGSNGFEADNDGQGTDATPYSNATFSNISIYGPLATPDVQINSQYRRGAHLRRNTRQDLYNSNIAGYPTGLLLDGSSTESNATDGLLQIRNSIFSGMTNNFAVASGSSYDLSGWFNSASFGNSVLNTNAELLVGDPFNLDNPDFIPQTGSPLLNGADFSNSNLQDAYIEQVNFRGAFGSTNWTDCWSNFTPQTTEYTGTIFNPGAIAEFTNAANGLTANFTNGSTNATGYLWDFGVSGTTTDVSTDANPTFTYPSSGVYTVSLTAFSPCGDSTITQQINVTVGINEVPGALAYVRGYPNPVNDQVRMDLTLSANSPVSIQLSDIVGKVNNLLYQNKLTQGDHSLQFDMSNLNPGLYFVTVIANGSSKTLRFVKQ